VSLDFEDGSTVNKGNLFTWDGLWTGIRPTGVAEIIIGQQVVSVYGSFDYDSTNRFYFLSSSGGNDIGENGESRIEWQRINEGALINEKALTVSTLQSTRVEYFNAIGKTTINQSFKPDDYACFTSFPTADINPEPSCAAVQACGSSINSRPIAGHLNFLFNCSQPQLNTNRPVNKGSSFSIRTVGIGAVSIRAIYVFGSDELLQHPEPQVCSNAPIDCCSYDDNYLSYLIK
jgi:hypothetical protein